MSRSEMSQPKGSEQSEKNESEMSESKMSESEKDISLLEPVDEKFTEEGLKRVKDFIISVQEMALTLAPTIRGSGIFEEAEAAILFEMADQLLRETLSCAFLLMGDPNLLFTALKSLVKSWEAYNRISASMADVAEVRYEKNEAALQAAFVKFDAKMSEMLQKKGSVTNLPDIQAEIEEVKC